MAVYNSKSKKAEEFINHEHILETLEYAEAYKDDLDMMERILEKGRQYKGLTYKEAATLLECENPGIIQKIFHLGKEIKEHFYGNRIVMFAPLYLSNHCINGCVYCPYHGQNKSIPRKKLTQEEIREEVIALQDMGHKRLALEAGEDPVNNPIEYILESIKTIYSIKHKNGAIRRVNVNIAATSVEAGIDDVGCGVLFGLENYKYDFVGMLMHAHHLEETYGCGPHTISVPRIRPADDIDPETFDNGVPDDVFKRIVAVLRIAVPYTGMIMSTRESEKTRRECLEIGITQISGGSRTSVGGYTEEERVDETAQFDVEDRRTLSEVVSWLIDLGYVPSFCTACYREGRTGDRFMSLLKAGQIANICQPNALMTLKEFLMDYADEKTHRKGDEIIAQRLAMIPNEKIRELCREHLEEIEKGNRDFRF